MDVLSGITYAVIWSKDEKEKLHTVKAGELSTKGKDIIYKESITNQVHDQWRSG
jgi:hypothetical protein